MRERARRPLAYDKMCLHSRPMQHLQQPHTKDRSGRASDADDEACGFFRLHAKSFSMKYAACRKEAEAKVAHNRSREGGGGKTTGRTVGRIDLGNRSGPAHAFAKRVVSIVRRAVSSNRSKIFVLTPCLRLRRA